MGKCTRDFKKGENMKKFIIAGFAAVALVGCSAPAPTKPVDCLEVSETQAQDILEGVKGTAADAGYKLVRAAGLKSDTGDTFIAIEFTVKGDKLVGVWQQTPKGLTGSVNAFAKSYTQWPDTKNAGAPIVNEVKACLK